MPVFFDERRKQWFSRSTVHLPDGTRKRVWARPGVEPWEGHSNTKVGAQRVEQLAIQRALGGKPARPEPRKESPTFGKFSEEYMARMKTTGNKRVNKPATLDAKWSHLKTHLLPRFGDKRLDAIDDAAVDELRLALAKAGRTPKTVNNIVATLHNILKRAKRDKLIATMPEFEWFQVDPDDQSFDFFDFKESERLLEGAAKVEEWSCAILLAVKSGMRLGELRALRWQDVDLVGGKLHVRVNLWRHHEGTPKNGRARTIDLPASAVAALKAHRHLRGERVFLDPAGQDYTIGAWRHGLYRACKRAGVRVVGWHVLRHTTASHLMMRGVPIKAISEQLGHRTLQMTMRYAHLAPGASKAAVAKLDEPAPFVSADRQPTGIAG